MATISKNWVVKYLAILVLCSLSFGYQPTPAPPLDPNEVSFVYDPNQCLSEPIMALIIRVGEVHIGELKVTEPDGDPVTFILSNENITIDAEPYYDVKDPNDELGMARIYRFAWQWTPGSYEVGLHYINVRVCDPYEAFDERTMIILVKDNQAPVITGCK